MRADQMPRNSQRDNVPNECASKDGPAFPTGSEIEYGGEGMTLQQYAAIHLRVPNSGEEWLDDMIRESLRGEERIEAVSGYANEFPTSVSPVGRDRLREEMSGATSYMKGTEQETKTATEVRSKK